METQFRQVLERSASSELNNPTNIEEESRKRLFPQICSEECKYKTCGFHTQENYGKACQMQWQQYKTEKKVLPDPLAHIETQARIDKIVKKAFEPFEKRLREIENEPEYHAVQRSINFNGQKMHACVRVDRDMNQN